MFDQSPSGVFEPFVVFASPSLFSLSMRYACQRGIEFMILGMP